MEIMRTSLIGSVFLFMLLLSSFHIEDHKVVAEADGKLPNKDKGTRLCDALSHRYKGYCMSDTICAAVCRTEGFKGGHCVGFRHRCFCKRPCAN